MGIRHPNGIYQPLPTPAYEVDILLGFKENEISQRCADVEQIYVQNVNSQATNGVVGTFRPVITPNTVNLQSSQSLCPFNGTNTGLGCTPNMFPWNYVQYKEAWQTACSTYVKDLDLPHNNKKLKGIFLPLGGGDMTVNAKNGQVRHTILIVKAKTPAMWLSSESAGYTPVYPLIRATLQSFDKIDSARNTLSVFSPIAQPLLGGSVIHDRSVFNESCNVFKDTNSNGVEIPEEYMPKNLKKWYNLVIAFFMFTIVISLYYVVVDVDLFGKMPYIVLALSIRLPSVGIAMFTGNVLYFVATLFHALSYFSKRSIYKVQSEYVGGASSGNAFDSAKKDDTKRQLSCSKWSQETLSYFFLLAAFALYMSHTVLWFMHVYHSSYYASFSLAYNTNAVENSNVIVPVHMKLLTNFLFYFPGADGIVQLVILGFSLIFFSMNACTTGNWSGKKT